MPKARPRISKHYNLAIPQSSLDFVDVRIVGDTPLFVDPVALARIDSQWTNACASTVQSFFQRELDAITGHDHDGARRLLSYLSEDNATRLGYSERSLGSGLGDELAEAFYQELSTSAAIATGLITDIEDTALFIEGVGPDRISDVTTNIIREQLAQYTEEAANFYDIPLVSGIAIYVWDPIAGDWATKTVSLPVPPKGGPLLLTPKAIARGSLIHDSGTYYRHYALNSLRDQEYQSQSPLVTVLKSGARRVYKKDVEAKYRGKHRGGPGVEKRVNVDATQKDPDLLDRFKRDRSRVAPITDAETIAEATATSLPDFDSLLGAVLALTPGKPDAPAYENAAEALLSALFYPDLVDPRRERKIHDGRKRIDISYTNAARAGFFGWAATHFPCASVFVECKNFGRPIGNPEYDQIAGRFSPSRGKVGLLVYRSFEDKSKVEASCRDTARDDRGFILALDDDDLRLLVDEAKAAGTAAGASGLLKQRFDALIM